MATPDITTTGRQVAAVIAIVAAATLVTRVILRMEEDGGVLAAISHLSQFFTILTNTLICLMMAWIAAGRAVNPRVIHALVIAIVCVGIVYHALLAHLVDFRGLSLIADHGVHTVVPLLSVIWWIWFAPKPRFARPDLVLWVVWPLVYCVYILFRAQFSGFYPYPFLNLPELGVPTLALNIVGLAISFIVVGGFLYGIGRLLVRGLQHGDT